MLDKKNFRLRQIKVLEKIDQSAKREEEQSIMSFLFKSDEWAQSKVIGITLSQVHEFNTEPIIEEAREAGKTIVIPRTFNDPARTMEFVELNANTELKPKAFGIMEPSNGPVFEKERIELMIVPGVAFERESGFRVGFGAGYYDRYLSMFNGITMSLALKKQVFKSPEWTVDQFDVPIQIICSTEGLSYAAN